MTSRSQTLERFPSLEQDNYYNQIYLYQLNFEGQSIPH